MANEKSFGGVGLGALRDWARGLFYQKPSSGIPDTDLSSDVQTSLGKADTAYQKPSGGIPSSDMESAVQTSLGKANSAYQKPSGGIPSTDMASAVQTSLGKADTALQAHQDISGKENTSNKVTSISSSSTDTQYPSAKCVYDAIGDVESAYHKPSGGIPSTDMTDEVQTSLGKADSAYQKPSGGIPNTDLSSAVQSTLGLIGSLGLYVDSYGYVCQTITSD